MMRQIRCMTKAGGRAKNRFPLCVTAANGRRHCLLLVSADTISQAAGLPTFKTVRQQSGVAKSQAVTFK